ncbi:MAG: hypothetical protein ABSG31_12810 [Tepidisphaeraceae bacterium]
MRRNRWLWISSGVALVGIVGLLAWYFFQTQISPRTALSLTPENLQPLSLPAGVADVLTQNDSGNAGAIYLSAAEAYESQQGQCDQFADKPIGDPPAPIAQILSAAGTKCDSIFAGNPSAIVNYDAEHPPLDDLQQLGSDMDKIGLILLHRHQADDAKRYFTAVYALGWGMYSERLNYDEYQKGMGLLNESSQGLAECEPASATELSQASDSRVRFDTDHVQPIYTKIVSIDPQDVADYAGDVFAFATDCQDRMLRVEAILKLGRYRFDAAKTSDQTAAPKTLSNLAGNSDPVVAAAANAALNLTLDQYRTIH